MKAYLVRVDAQMVEEAGESIKFGGESFIASAVANALADELGEQVVVVECGDARIEIRRSWRDPDAHLGDVEVGRRIGSNG